MLRMGSLVLLLVVAVLAAPKDAAIALAAQDGDLARVRTLLGEKADVNAPLADGTTALHLLVRAGDLSGVELLLKSGADVNANNRQGVDRKSTRLNSSH